MSRIDGYGSGNTINPAETGQIQSSDEIKARSAGQATTDADAAAYLKIGAKPPLPAFAGTVSQGDTAEGKKALQVIGHNIGIDYSALLALIVKLSSEERKASSEAAVMDIQAVAAQTKSAANDIRSGATLALVGGIVSSSINIGAGAVSIAGGGMGMRTASAANAPAAPTDIETSAPETTTAETEPSAPSAEMVKTAPSETGAPGTESSESTSAETTEDAAETAQEDISETEAKQSQSDTATDLEKSMKSFAGEGRMFMISQRANSIATITQGVSSSMQGAAGGVQSGFKFASDMKQADSKVDEADAQKMQAGLEKERDYGKSAAEDVKKMMDIFSQIEQSQHEARLKIVDTI